MKKHEFLCGHLCPLHKCLMTKLLLNWDPISPAQSQAFILSLPRLLPSALTRRAPTVCQAGSRPCLLWSSGPQDCWGDKHHLMTQAPEPGLLDFPETRAFPAEPGHRVPGKMLREVGPEPSLGRNIGQLPSPQTVWLNRSAPALVSSTAQLRSQQRGSSRMLALREHPTSWPLFAESSH